jgi:hypothetical protein
MSTSLLKRARPGLSALAVMMTASAFSAASADVDRSPAPGGIYKLKPGIFVAEGANCADPANAQIRLYDGRGISTAHTRACSARILSKKAKGRGRIFKVVQSCIDAGAGPGKGFTDRQTVYVRDALTFTMTSASSTTYHYCPIDQLPVDLRGSAQ